VSPTWRSLCVLEIHPHGQLHLPRRAGLCELTECEDRTGRKRPSAEDVVHVRLIDTVKQIEHLADGVEVGAASQSDALGHPHVDRRLCRQRPGIAAHGRGEIAQGPPRPIGRERTAVPIAVQIRSRKDVERPTGADRHDARKCFTDVLTTSAQMARSFNEKAAEEGEDLRLDFKFDSRLESNGTARTIYSKFSTLFHRIVEDARRDRVVGDSPLTVLSFSDSVFLVTPAPLDALRLSQYLMRRYIEERLPVEIGVGYGLFVPIRYSLDWAARQQTYGAQFVGTGLVTAHDAAAQRKANGLRVFIHESLLNRGIQSQDIRLLVLPEDEKNDKAVIELNYLFQEPAQNQAIVAAVREMQASAPPEAQRHYIGTLRALERMAADIGSFSSIASTTP
jgi:hypothetical protein